MKVRANVRGMSVMDSELFRSSTTCNVEHIRALRVACK